MGQDGATSPGFTAVDSMRIAIQTLGTRGDVQPYVALGLGLRRAGHDVVLATADFAVL